MEKTIEIPEGYEARIECNKVILKPKESEDERIRTRLIALVEAFGQGTYKDEMLAYLEKQKEQKSIEDVIKNITKNKEAATKFLKSAGIMDDNGELAEMYRSEQKTAEWSEEDEEHINSILERLEGMCKKGATFTQTRFAVSEDKDWLKSLRPQPHWKPSEEQYECIPAEEAYMRGFAQGAKEERERMLEDIIKMRDTAEKRGLNFGAVCGFQIALDELERMLTGRH